MMKTINKTTTKHVPKIGKENSADNDHHCCTRILKEHTNNNSVYHYITQ